ncbi:MFS transporter [Caloramator sp. E03]|uniref:MFS transporter n=1 Tax=Caloramator sp. E03 TaxID=2576307 RepID=UPI0011109CD6|nr:MFS transporter [Caloramator sp. E03]QCX33162.1 MFS transporter [Caloramator sp. E03]
MTANDKKIILLVLGLMAFLANGDNYAAAPLIINIAKDLNLSLTTAATSVTAYMLSFGLFTILFGPLGDRFGKTKIINIAAFGTAIFSMLGAFAFNLSSLVFFRAVNGAFGAGIFPVTMALIGEIFEQSERQKSIGKVMGMMFLGGASATFIGGIIAYFGSWRAVYFLYGLGELILAIVMFKKLPKLPGIINHLELTGVYKKALSNVKLISVVSTIMLVGFSVFGSFTYTGKFIQSKTGYNILIVGIILTSFGIATVVGGRIAPKLKNNLKNKFLLVMGLIGSASLYLLSQTNSTLFIVIALFGFGLAFVSLQSTLVSTSQETMPNLRGTAMSLASFNMFIGGAIGTSINGKIINYYNNFSYVFIGASIAMLIVSFIATYTVNNASKK